MKFLGQGVQPLQPVQTHTDRQYEHITLPAELNWFKSLRNTHQYFGAFNLMWHRNQQTQWVVVDPSRSK